MVVSLKVVSGTFRTGCITVVTATAAMSPSTIFVMMTIVMVMVVVVMMRLFFVSEYLFSMAMTHSRKVIH